jgi:hypothetical protein
MFRTSLAAVAIMAVSSSSSVAATVYQDTVVGENDPFPAPLQGTPALAKCDEGAEGVTSDTSCSVWEDADGQGGAEGDYSGAFSLTYTDPQSFSWSFDPSLVTGTANVLFPSLVAVKAGPDYAVFDITGGDLSGTVFDVGQHLISNPNAAISHVSFYDTPPNGGPNVIPLPAGVWLLLGGLGGLAALRRKSTS